MTHSKLQLRVLIVAIAVAALGVGCAFDTTATEPTESTSQSDVDLLKSAPTHELARDEVEQANGAVTIPRPVMTTPNKITTDHLLGGNGTEEGPRPHPWQPNPESGNTDTNTNSGTSSSDKKQSN